MASSLIAPLVSTAGSFGLSKLFGGSSSSSFSPPKINAGGLSGGSKIKASPERMGLVNNLAATFGPQADILKGLRQSVAPGFSALRSSRLAEVEGARTRAMGNLRENLARRRVLGSSFGEDAVLRGEAEFAKEKDRIQAETFLQEIEATQQLTQQEFEARRGEFQTVLDEFNLEAGIATQLTTAATQQLGANARIKAQLDASAAAGMGKFFGQQFQPALDSLSSKVSNFGWGGVGSFPY